VVVLATLCSAAKSILYQRVTLAALVDMVLAGRRCAELDLGDGAGSHVTCSDAKQPVSQSIKPVTRDSILVGLSRPHHAKQRSEEIERET
jgi:hypothetical protein